MLGCVVEHAWCGIQGASVCMRPSGQRSPAQLWHVLAFVWSVDDDFDADHLNVILFVLPFLGSPSRHRS